MPVSSSILHLMCGKIASGKSTLSAKLGAQGQTVMLSEDVWLGALFADQMQSVADYVRCSSRLQAVMGPHVISLLNAGASVVLDFPANTIQQRRWMREIVQQSGSAHQMHVLEVPDDVCLTRLHARNASGEHPFAVTEEHFHQITRHYEPPTPEEGFEIVRHSHAGED